MKFKVPASGHPGRSLAAAAAFLLLWLLFLQPMLEWAAPQERFWTGLLYALCAFPVVHFLGSARIRIPLMPMWGLGYFMMFGMPMFTSRPKETLFFVQEGAVTDALRLCAAGALFCLIGYYSLLGKWAQALTPRVKAPWDLRRAPAAGALLWLTGFYFSYLGMTSPANLLFGQLVKLLSDLSILGMLTLFLLHLRGKLSLPLKIFLWGFAFPIQYLMALGTGALYRALVVAAPLGFLYIAERRRIPFLGIALFVGLALIPFLGYKGEYRSYAWYGEEGPVVITRSPVQRGLAFSGLVYNRISQGGVEAYLVAAETAQERASHLGVLTEVMQMTPALVPFWRGETYRTLFWFLVPRFLYPDKPTKRVGNAFGQRYDFLSETDVSTSFNLPHQVIEMYVNFGKKAVVIGMFLLGCFYRILTAFLDRPQGNERALIIGCGLLAYLMNLDSDFSLIFGGVVYYLAIMFAASRLLSRSAPRAARSPASG